jgi:catechol 2,3-dioxygenase-like lactoylglutathione lyase family enzyme
MILGLDHVALAVADLDAAVASYGRLLGCSCLWRGEDDGAAHAWFRLGNMALAILARTGPGLTGDRIAARLRVSGEGLATMAFQVTEIEPACRLLARRALAASPPRELHLTNATTGATHQMLIADLTAEATHGVAMSLAQHAPAGPDPAPPQPDGLITGLDHVVIRSPDPERAIALFAGRLDLELRLDRTNPDWGARLLFFRCGDLVVEVAHGLAGGIHDGPDELWGLSWRTPDIEATHARLAADGIEVSEIRPGRRPGTRVFTVKDRSARLPTLVLART